MFTFCSFGHIITKIYNSLSSTWWCNSVVKWVVTFFPAALKARILNTNGQLLLAISRFKQAWAYLLFFRRTAVYKQFFLKNPQYVHFTPLVLPLVYRCHLISWHPCTLMTKILWGAAVGAPKKRAWRQKTPSLTFSMLKWVPYWYDS